MDKHRLAAATRALTTSPSRRNILRGLVSTGFAGQCNTTTGNAGYCLASSICYPCAKDADCRTVCGAKAACLTCTDCMETGGTMCGNPDFPGCSAT